MTIWQFGRSEFGGVSAEIVVVTAGAIGLALAVMTTLGDGVLDTSDALSTEMESKADISYTVQND